MNMSSWVPSGKVTAAGVAGAVLFIFVQVANQYWLASNPLSSTLVEGIPLAGALVAAYITQPTTSDVAKVAD